MTKVSEPRNYSTSESSQMETAEEERVKKFAKRMLKGTMFVGSFKEKRFVQPLNDYRDVIQVANDEDKFIENLMAVRKRCANFYGRGIWIGITDPQTIGAPAGFNLWVTLNVTQNEEVFGSYWYTVKKVSFHRNEVALRLEMGKPYTDKHNCLENVVNTSKKAKDPSQIGGGDSWDILKADDLRLYAKKQLRFLFTEVINVTNVKDAVIFVCLLLSTMMTFAVEAFKYLLDFSLKFMHEISGFITACTPITLGVLRVVMNAIMGLYTLIAYMWRSHKDPGPNFYQQHAAPLAYNAPRALTYQEDSFEQPSRPKKERGPNGRGYRYGSVVITPVDD